MALVDIVMPQMGESIAEGTLSKWLKKVGDEVKRDEPMFEISTDKVDAEIPASEAGVIAEILVKEGETVSVQTVVARLETEKGRCCNWRVSSGCGDRGQCSSATERGPPKTQGSTPPTVSPNPPPRQPFRRKVETATHSEERIRTKSSPLVRKIAAEHGVDISALHGSGIAGRVTKRDLMGFISEGIPPPRAQGRCTAMRYTCRSRNPGPATSSSRCPRCAR